MRKPIHMMEAEPVNSKVTPRPRFALLQNLLPSLREEQRDQNPSLRKSFSFVFSELMPGMRTSWKVQRSLALGHLHHGLQ